MKRIEQHRRRILWAGRWKTTSYHCTEDEIRFEHPEAERIEGTLRVLDLPETGDEITAHARTHSTSGWSR
jgi:hypothetical protein